MLFSENPSDFQYKLSNSHCHILYAAILASLVAATHAHTKWLYFAIMITLVMSYIEYECK